MSRESNLAVQERFGAAVNDGRLEDLDELVAPDCVDHDPAPGQGAGARGYREMFGELRQAFPDLHVEVEHATVTGEDVAIAYTLTGTQDGPFMGHAPTGRPVSVRGVQIARFADGRMVERWGSSDQLGMLAQLGLAEPS